MPLRISLSVRSPNEARDFYQDVYGDAPAGEYEQLRENPEGDLARLEQTPTSFDRTTGRQRTECEQLYEHFMPSVAA